jgi:hypothetical protein
VNPENSRELTCPYCQEVCCTSRTHYYKHHYDGQCLQQQQQHHHHQQQQHQHQHAEDSEWGAYVDDSGQQHTGAAADIVRQHDEAVAQFQQVCIDAGLDHQQLLALQAGLQHLADPFRQLLEQYQQDEEDEAEAEHADTESEQQTAALQQRLQGQFCRGESQATALGAWVRLFEWRCNYNIKVIDLRSLALCP